MLLPIFDLQTNNGTSPPRRFQVIREHYAAELAESETSFYILNVGVCIYYIA